MRIEEENIEKMSEIESKIVSIIGFDTIWNPENLRKLEKCQK